MADETDRYAGVMGEALDEIESIGSTTPAPPAEPMTDERVTEIVRAATFGKAIRLADIVRASDLDSQRKEEFRQAIGLVWMRGVRELAREVRRLRAELEADRSVGHGAKHWHDTYQQSMNAVDEFFVELLGLMPGAADEGMDAYDQIPRGIEKLTAERDEARVEAGRRVAPVEVAAFQRERNEARAEAKRWREEERRQRESAQAAKAGWLTAANEVEQLRTMYDDLCKSMSRTGDRLAAAEAERDRARTVAASAEKTLGEQIDRAVQAEAAAAVLQSAADEANRRIVLARRTAAELHEFNSPEGEHLDGCPGCRLEAELGEARPDPYLLALEAVAQRYPEAFAWHLADQKAKATRTSTT